MIRRNRELARIHCLRRDLALSDDEYTAALWSICRVESAKDLDEAGRARIIRHLSALAKKSKVRTHRGRPTGVDGDPQLRKIEALLADAGRPWAYAQKLAKRICHRDAIEFCSPDERRKLIAALTYDQQRREAK